MWRQKVDLPFNQQRKQRSACIKKWPFYFNTQNHEKSNIHNKTYFHSFILSAHFNVFDVPVNKYCQYYALHRAIVTSGFLSFFITHVDQVIVIIPFCIQNAFEQDHVKIFLGLWNFYLAALKLDTFTSNLFQGSHFKISQGCSSFFLVLKYGQILFLCVGEFLSYSLGFANFPLFWGSDKLLAFVFFLVGEGEGGVGSLSIFVSLECSEWRTYSAEKQNHRSFSYLRKLWQLTSASLIRNWSIIFIHILIITYNS